MCSGITWSGGRGGGATIEVTTARVTYLLGEDVLQREAEGGGQSADEPRHVKGQFGHGGQQHAADDGDE